GRWEQRNGGSFWVFYGRYRLMQDLFWGPSYYSPIRRNHYDSYRSSVGSGKAWFGSSREYGTSGTTTRKKYASSTYYKRSAASARSASGSSGSSSGTRYSGSRYSSSSSRSGGYRSSRSRSSSFGGSGK
ncbi:MAG: hypothetical protein KC613_26030, partial [Myxococcales bacterium]|nr:hypothetical protein [Myxococcales bacterium]